MGVPFITPIAVPTSQMALYCDLVANIVCQTPSPTDTTMPQVSWPVIVPGGTFSDAQSSHFQI